MIGSYLKLEFHILYIWQKLGMQGRLLWKEVPEASGLSTGSWHHLIFNIHCLLEAAIDQQSFFAKSLASYQHSLALSVLVHVHN